jgi:hypothetical protein
MQRITEKQLESLVQWINELTNSPATSYTRTDDKLTANIGNYHLYFAYGGVNLHRMTNTGGGVSTPLGGGTRTKRELFNQLHAFINGIQTNREAIA